MASPPPPPPPPPPQIAEVEMADENLQLVPEQQLPEQPPNPLLMDVVLDNLFGYVDFADLSQCRRVSKLWNQVSLPHWLRKAPRLHLDLNPDFTDSTTDDANPKKITTVSKFIRLVDRDFYSYGPYECAALRQYKTFGIKGDLGVGLQRQFFGLFLRNYGQQVKDLALSLRFPDVDTYRAVMFSTKSPNLVKLELEFSFAEGVIVNHELDNFEFMEGRHTKLTSLQIECQDRYMSSLPVKGWMQLLMRYPNLQTIVYGIKRLGVAGSYNLLEAIWKVREFDKQYLDLKCLEIGCFLRINNQRSLAPLFQDSQLSLERLRLCAEGTPDQRIHEVLTWQAPTLKSLCLQKFIPFQNFQPPRMDFVESLELIGYPFENLAFLKSFPRLKSLIVTSEGLLPEKLHSILNATTREHLEELNASSLTSFRANYKSFVSHGYQDDISPDDIRKLAQCMPNLTDLQLWVDNATFRMVCQCWPRLQHLCVIGTEVDVSDWGIAGLHPGVKVGKRKYKSLKELKSLTMTHLDKAYLVNPELRPTIVSGRLTERSFRAFLHLPKLEKLEISLPQLELELNPTLLGRLKDKIKCFKVKFAQNQDESTTDDDF